MFTIKSLLSHRAEEEHHRVNESLSAVGASVLHEAPKETMSSSNPPSDGIHTE